MPELEVSSGSFLSQIVALDLTIRPSKKSLAAGAAKSPRVQIMLERRRALRTKKPLPHRPLIRLA